MKSILLTKRDMLRAIGFVLIIASVIVFSNYIIQETIETIAENSGKNLPIYSVDTDKKVVSLTFDAAWGNEDTETLLNILKENDVKATFFLCGYWVEKYPEDVKKIYEAGHDIGNHSATHPQMTNLSSEQCKDEIMKVHDAVYELTGYEMDLFRPPYGAYDEKVINAAREVGYYTIQWDVDSLDWKEYGVDHEIKTVLEHKNLQNGSIILFHNDTKYTPDALGPIIEGLKAQGYSFVPLSELIIKENYKIDHTGRQFKVNEDNQTVSENDKI